MYLVRYVYGTVGGFVGMWNLFLSLYTFDNKLYILTKVYCVIWAMNLQYRKKY